MQLLSVRIDKPEAANPSEAVIARTDRGRDSMGVVDGASRYPAPAARRPVASSPDRVPQELSHG